MSRRGITLLTAGAIAIVLGVLAAILPVPYVVLVPGPPTDTLGNVGSTPVISVTGRTTYSTGGHLYLTTVGVIPASCDRDPTLSQAIRAWFDSHQAVQPKQAICPPHQSSQQVQQQNADEMSQSQLDAQTAALLYLGIKPSSLRLVVGEVEAGTPAATVLQAGDALLAVDGIAVTGPVQLHGLIGAHPAGSTVRISIERGGHKQDVKVKTYAGNSGPLIGISLDQHATFSSVHVRIGIDPNSVGGPSAGLMFTLGIIDKLTAGGITGGKTIAGTGTIDGFGTVGPIGGIQQKIAAATGHGPEPRVHASYFLAPRGECRDAKAAAPKGLVLVSVDTLRTAVTALKAIAAGSNDFPHC
jgi:PDZ domain-containing protein